MGQTVLHFLILFLLSAVDASNHTSETGCSTECVEYATCVDGTCVCHTGHSGEGDFYCVDESKEYFCRLLNDPGLQNFEGERVIIDPVASTLLAQFSAKRLARYAGTVDVTLSAWTIRYEGKMYYKGIELILKQTLYNGTYDVEVIRVYACGMAGATHTWTVQSKKPVDVDFSLVATVTSEDEIADSSVIVEKFGCDIEFKRGAALFYHVHVICADLKYGIRAFTPGNLDAVPGIFVVMSKDCNPTYETWNRKKPPICLRPGLKFKYITKILKISDVRSAVTVMSIINGGSLSYDNAPKGLKRLKKQLYKCNVHKRKLVAQALKWALGEPLFIKCISGNDQYQGNLVKFLIKLIKWFCKKKVNACSNTKTAISNRCADVKDEYSEIQNYFTSLCIPTTTHSYR